MNIAAFDTDNYSNKFIHFKQLCYPDKLSFFHAHFGIIPFSFPAFDTKISWYNNESQLSQLIENFYKERPKKFIPEKIFTEQDRIVKFNVQPVSPTQRIQYNRFVIYAFLEANLAIKKNSETNLQTEDNPVGFLISQINFLTSVQEWMKGLMIEAKVKTSLRAQFVQILLYGLSFYDSGKQITIQKRRKFVELYLFSQGFFLAEYLSTLQKRLKRQS